MGAATEAAEVRAPVIAAVPLAIKFPVLILDTPSVPPTLRPEETTTFAALSVLTPNVVISPAIAHKAAQRFELVPFEKRLFTLG